MRTQHASTGCLLLAMAGIAVTGYLMVLHLGLERGELLGGAVCGAGGAFNCHVVTGSTWSTVLGLPLALWGMIGYLTVFALALLAKQSDEWAQHAMALVAVLAIGFLLVDAGLLGVMLGVIRSVCILCLATYGINLLLLWFAWRSLNRPLGAVLSQVGAALGAIIPSDQRPTTWLFWGVLAVGMGGSLAVHAATLFVSRGTLASVQGQLREYVSRQPRVGVPLADDPTLGPPTAGLRVVEFSDFFCPACQRAAKLNHIIVSSHRNDMAFVFKNFPLDTSCNDKVSRMVHPGACQIAAAGECAHQQGKFWAFHDLIFEEGPNYQIARLEEDARRLGFDVQRFSACLSSGQGMEAVKRDVADAGQVEVSSTPTYVINGLKLAGMLTPSRFEEFVQALRDSK